MKRLEGKVAVVTGAGRGVGKAYADALASEGASVVVNDLGVSVKGAGKDAMVAEQAAEEIRKKGGSAIANYDDISNFAGAARLMNMAVEHFGRLDILVANAGIIRPTNLFEAKEEDWSQVLAIHANGTFNCYRHCAPLLMKQRSGTIITTGHGSDPYLSGKDPFPGIAAYRAAKAAIQVLTFAAAYELRPFNVNINTIMPGSTATRMQAAFNESLMNRGLSAEEKKHRPTPAPVETVPPLGVFLCTEQGRSITGRSFTINGGRITMITAPPVVATLDADGDSWTVDALAQRLPQWITH